MNMPRVLRSYDVAVFPNRAEGGTNLAAMKALGYGVPTIFSNNTGHLDLTVEIPCYVLEQQNPVPPQDLEDGTEEWHVLRDKCKKPLRF